MHRMRSYRIDNALRHLRKFAHGTFRNKEADAYDVKFDPTYAVYEKVARDLGLTYSDFGRCKQVSDGNKAFRFWMDCTEFCTFPLIGITEDKAFVSQHLAAHGVPAPKGRAFHWRDEDAAVAFGMSLGGPFVIKPAADTQGGLGVFTNLRSKAQARRAFRLAATVGDQLLVEQYVTGENFRVLIYKGQCLSVLHRRRPGVTGDGQSTIAQLVARENEHRIKKADWRIGDPPFAPLILNKVVLQELANQNRSVSDVLAAGETAVFSDICNYGRGATLREVIEDFSPAIIRGAVKAAQLFDAPLAGVDVIVPAADSDVYCINEVNVGPSPELHYLIDNPEKGQDPLGAILKDVFGLA
jgi:cyanophycin synthetase